MYIHNALKVFGSWTADLASDWRESHLEDVKKMVELIVAAMGTYTSKSDVEVQERVRDGKTLETLGI